MQKLECITTQNALILFDCVTAQQFTDPGPIVLKLHDLPVTRYYAKLSMGMLTTHVNFNLNTITIVFPSYSIIISTSTKLIRSGTF